MVINNRRHFVDKQVEDPHVFRFLTGHETAELKVAVGENNHRPSVEESRDPSLSDRHFLAVRTNLMVYDAGDESVCLAWVLGDEESFITHYVHEEIHRVLHKHIGYESCCAYDKIAAQVEGVSPRGHCEVMPIKLEYFPPYGLLR